MSILKGILKYGLILIALLVGSAFVLGAVMVLVPSVSVFGMRYAKVEQEGNGYEVVDSQNIGGVSDIKINADSYNVIITRNTKEKLSIRVKLDAIGFYKTQYKEVVVDGEKTEVAKSVEETFMPATNLADIANGFGTELVITANPVEGILSYTNRDIIVSLPPSFNVINTVEVETTTGVITVKDCAVDTLKLKTDSGEQNLTNVLVNDEFMSESRKGALNVGVSEGTDASNYSLNCSLVTLKNKFGDIKFAEGINIGNSHEDKLVIENDKSKITLNNVNANVKYTGEAGLVNIKSTYGEVDITSNDAKFNIDTVAGASFGFKAVGNGLLTLNIGDLDVNTAHIVTAGGAIDIERLKAIETTKIESNTGNVNIKEVYKSVIVKTKSGNITLAQPANLADKNITITVETEKGIVDLTKIVSATSVKSTTGNIRLSVLEVNGNIDVQTEIGKTEVLLPITTYDLVTSAVGTVKVEDLAVTVNTNALTTSHINHTEGECTGAHHVVTVKSLGGDITVTGIVR